jgi:hypothetical protein
LTFSSNTQKLVILLFTLVVSIAFNACGDPLANQVTITTEPDNPEVVKVDLPADDDKFDGAVAPWFLLDYKIANASDQTFVLTRLELTSRRLGSVDSNSTVIEVSLLDNGEGYEDYLSQLRLWTQSPLGSRPTMVDRFLTMKGKVSSGMCKACQLMPMTQ